LRTHRSILSFATGVAFTAVTMLTAFFTTPLLLDWLGDDRFGAFRMIVDCHGYLTLLDFGLSGAVSPLLARALGQGDRRALEGTLAAGTRAYLKLTGLTLAVGLAALPLFVVLVSRRVDLSAHPGLVADLRWAWVVCLLSFLPSALAPFRALAEARQRGYWVNVLLTVQCLLITALSLALAWEGWGITGQAWAFTIGIGTFFGLLTWSGLRHNPGLWQATWATAPGVDVQRAIWSLSLPSFAIAASGRIGLLSDSLVAGGFLGPALAASLYVTLRLVSVAQTQLQSVGTVSWAALAELHAQGDRETFNRRLLELTNLVALLGIAALVPIAAYNRHFFDLWVSQKRVAFGGEVLTAIAAANALFLGLYSLWGWCFSGTGQVRTIVVPAIAATVVNLAASLLFTWQLGLVGPVLGTLVANLAVYFWCLPVLLRRSFGIPLRALAGAVAWPLLWGVPFAAGLWWWAHAHRPWGWMGLAAEMGASALGFLALGSVVILSPTDRALWRLRLATLVRLRPL
jgi:O-antigen/teichoic acid export membrane protein